MQSEVLKSRFVGSAHYLHQQELVLQITTKTENTEEVDNENVVLQLLDSKNFTIINQDKIMVKKCEYDFSGNDPVK